MTAGGPRIGKCIYCGATRYSAAREWLGREHVVAQRLGGTLTILEACCEACERIINKEAEEITLNEYLGPLRHRLGLSASKSITALPIQISRDGETFEEVMVPIDDVPITLAIPLWDEPGILPVNKNIVVRGPGVTPRAEPGFYQLEEAEKARSLMEATGAKKVVSYVVKISLDAFARTVAKTAHAYAVYKLGLAFEPFLQDLILGQSSARPITDYVGGAPAAMHMPRDLSKRHLLELVFADPVIFGDKFLIVNIVLFNDLGFPPYRVVAGRYSK
jgi:hypothetical protein